MTASKVFSTITALVPFWVSSIVKYYGLGSEYSMTLNVALSQLIVIGESKLTDNVLISIIGLCLGLITCYRMGYQVTDLFGVRKMNSMTICGYEEKTTNNYPVSMEALSSLRSKNPHKRYGKT